MKQTIGFEKLNEDMKLIYDRFASLESLSAGSLDAAKTLHIAVDMVNGFVKYGALSSKEVLSINDAVAAFAGNCQKTGIMNFALCDCHPNDCSEFLTYPVHCVENTMESQLTDELENAADFRIFPKLSVNGWLEDDFRSAVINGAYDTFIITGDCTDMCVLQLALSMKSGLNRINRASRIIIPTDLVATCSLPNRLPESAEIAAFLVMESNGIELVKNIVF